MARACTNKANSHEVSRGVDHRRATARLNKGPRSVWTVPALGPIRADRIKDGEYDRHEYGDRRSQSGRVREDEARLFVPGGRVDEAYDDQQRQGEPHLVDHGKG